MWSYLDLYHFDSELRMKVGGPGLVLFLLHLVSVHAASEYLNEEPVSSS